MDIKTAITTNPIISEAVSELKEQLIGDNDANDIISIIFFASIDYDSDMLISSFNDVFKEISVFGASSCVEILNGKHSTSSIVAMRLPRKIIEDVKVVSLENVSFSASIDLLPVIKEFSSHYGGSFFTLPKDIYFGVSFMTFSTRMETILFEQLRKSTNIQFTGAVASAGDISHTTFVYANGKAISQGVVLALFKSATAFNFDKIENVEELPYKFAVSEIDNERHLIKQLDGRIAAEALCSVLNIDINGLREQLDDYILGSYSDNIPFLCSILEVTSEGYISVLRTHIPLGATFSLFKNSPNIIEETRNHILTHKGDTEPIGFIHFQCIFRYNYLRRLGKISDYENIFSLIPNIGFCTFGEYYIGYVNMTSTILIFNKTKVGDVIQTSGECHKLMMILFNKVAKGQSSQFSYIRTKLILKGINPDKFGPTTLDNPKELGILRKFVSSISGRQF